MPRPADLRDLRFKPTIFNRIRDEISARAGSGQAPIALHVGDTYFDLPPELDEPLPAEPWNARLSRYGETQGETELRRRLFKKVVNKNRLPLTSEHEIQIVFGATGGLFLAMRRLLDEGDEVLALSPQWTILKVVAATAGVKLVEVPFFHRVAGYDLDSPPSGSLEPRSHDTGRDGRNRPSADEIASWIEPYLTERTRALYFNNPNNPSGVMMSRAELAAVAEFAKRHDLWVFSDEAYEDFVYTGEPYASVGSLPGMYERTVSVFSFSKSYAAAGIRLGYVCAAPGPLARMHPAHVGVGYEPNRPSQVQGIRALARSEQIVPRLQRAYRECREAAIANLKRPYIAADGSFYLFIDLRETWAGLDDNERLKRMFEAGVVLAPGEPFGAACDGFARFCYTAEPPEKIAEAARRVNDL
ncbi:MAG: Arginine--pyruvate transaminase AruH [Calditrichaeota bacterium]|nr:Arginine--pyruvate transaminase AruH [Calditrichota bacterium]